MGLESIRRCAEEITVPRGDPGNPGKVDSNRKYIDTGTQSQDSLALPDLKPDFSGRVAFRRFERHLAELVNSGCPRRAYQEAVKALEENRFAQPSQQEALVYIIEGLASVPAYGQNPAYDSAEFLMRGASSISQGFSLQARGYTPGTAQSSVFTGPANAGHRSSRPMLPVYGNTGPSALVA
jgi:hypothetical protein